MDNPAESMNCVLRVDTRTVGWQVMVVRILKSIDGITYKIDEEKGTVQITGSINPRQLMKRLAEVGLHADLTRADSKFREMNVPVRNVYDYGSHGRSEYYYGYPPIQQRTWQPIYENYPYYFHHFYEPRAHFFPQPPAPPEGFRSGDPEWCSIM